MQHPLKLCPAWRTSIGRAVRGLALGVLAAMGCGAPVPRASTVVYASGADLESANPILTVHPLARQVQRFALFLTLARYDAALTPQPYLARQWEWSADRRRLTLSLVRAARWHDGVATTARDVTFTLDAARNPATGSPRVAELAAVQGVTTVDDSTVRVDFVGPQPEFPAVLCELPIAPAHLLAAVAPDELRRAAFNTAPVGNGPYRFVRREPGRRWVFERDAAFPATLGGPPAFTRLVVVVVDEPTTKFAGLVSGDLDVAGISPGMAPLAVQDPSLRVLTYPVAFSFGLVFNTTRPPFDDARVRRALSAFINRERIARVALGGYAVPAAGPVGDAHRWYLPTPALTRANARALLDSAGFPRGNGGLRRRGSAAMSFTLLTVGSGDNAMEQLVQDDLRREGIAVAVRQVELGAFLTAARGPRRDFDVLATGIPGDAGLSHLASMFDSGLRGGALDYAGFHDARLDSLFHTIRSAVSTQQLGSAWGAVQEELVAQSPVAWLYHARGLQGVAANIAGLQMDARGELATLASWRRVPSTRAVR